MENYSQQAKEELATVAIGAVNSNNDDDKENVLDEECKTALDGISVQGVDIQTFEDDDNEAVNTTSSKNVDKVVEQSDTGDDESKSQL